MYCTFLWLTVYITLSSQSTNRAQSDNVVASLEIQWENRPRSTRLLRRLQGFPVYLQVSLSSLLLAFTLSLKEATTRMPHAVTTTLVGTL